MPTSIISDESLMALEICIPEYARNQTARIIEDPVSRPTNTYINKCRCGKHFTDLASLVVRCQQHLSVDINSPLQPNVKSTPSLGERIGKQSIRKLRKRIKVIDTGRLKFECKECSTWFSERYKYNDHVACHQNPLLRCCEVCKTQFTNGIRAIRHIAKFHPELLQQREEEYKLVKALHAHNTGRKRKTIKSRQTETIKVIPIEDPGDRDYLSNCSETYVTPDQSDTTKPKQIEDVPEKQEKETEEEGKKRHQCPLCLKQCHACNIKKHILSHNLYSSTTACLICGLNLKHNLKLKSHMTTVHKTNWYDFIRKKTKRKVKEGDIDDLIFCESCYLPLEDVRQKEVHILLLHSKRSKKRQTSLACRICQKTFYSPVNRRIHEQRFHSNVPMPINSCDFICDYCGASYQYKGHLKQHILRHITPQTFYSEATKKRYGLIKKSELEAPKGNRHRYRVQFVKQEDSDKVKIQFNCTECAQHFLKHEEINQHLKQAHPRTASTNYICEHCGLAFAEKNSLKGHLFTAHGHGKDDTGVKTNNTR